MLNSKELKNFLKKYNTILIVAGQQKKLDTLSASCALAFVLERLGKNSTIYFPFPIPEEIQFIGLNRYISFSQEKIKIENSTNNWDAIILISTNKQTANTTIPILNIYTTNKTTSLSESLTRIIKELDESYITKPVATSLLTGITAATQNFQNSSTRPQTLFTAAYLISKNAENQKIVKHLYKTKPLEFIKLWGCVVSKFSYGADKRIGWSTLTRNDIVQCNAEKSHVIRLINELKNSFAQIDIFVLGIEQGKNKKSAFIHTTKTGILNNYASKNNLSANTSSLLLPLGNFYDIQRETKNLIQEIEKTL